MENKFNDLMMVVAELIKEGYKIGAYTLIDIKNERKDREINLIPCNHFNFIYFEGKISLSTSSSNQTIDDTFMEQVNFLNMLKEQFNNSDL